MINKIYYLEAASQNPVGCQNKTKDFVAFAFATRRHLRLLALGSPGIAQRAPLGKTGLIAKKQQGVLATGIA